MKLSLFLAKYSVLNLFLLLVRVQFPIQEHYIHMSRHRKATIRSEWTFFCLCSYECNDTEWENAYKQATKTGLIQNISLGREKESFIMFSFWGNQMDSPPKLRALYSGRKPSAGQYHCQHLSFENLHSLFNRNVPKTGIWCLMFCEHLNSNT